ncbi:MAG TPA: EAL domain-containing protein [Gammaproteobacteria bacterium]
MAISTSANVILPQRDVDRQIEGEMANLLFRNSQGLHVSTIIATVLITAVFWVNVSRIVLLLWAAYMILTSAARAWVAAQFKRREIPLENSGLWLQRFQSGNLLSGLGWGAAGILLFLPGNSASQMILTVIVVTAIAVSLPSLSASRRLFVQFALLAITPLLVRHLLEGMQANLVAAGLLIFLFPLMTTFALRGFRQRVDELQARFAYADLARELSGEIAVRRQAEHRLLDLANYDQLTGLPNRALLRDRLEHSIAKARRRNGRIAVLFADIDRFKSINDSLGHHAGDEVLRTVAARVKKCIREENTVARMSGDEFIIVMEEFEDIDDVRSLARRVLMETSEPVAMEDGSDIKLTTSIGIALYPDHGREVEPLLQSADIAMYRAKTGGRNTFQLFSPDMHAEALTRLSRENALRRALENEEFFLAYQPQVDTFSGGYIGVEALIRWESPEYGLVAPGEFIPLAEDTGLIKPLGDWALRAACEQAAKFRQEFGREFHVSINLSARQLDPERTVQTIARVLEDTGVEPATLMFEITESVALTNAHANLTLLRKLRAMGCRLALDDFGTGNSSLTYLKRFPINCVKLDKSFIDNVSINREDAAIARATIQLANALELMVIAEGVESREQAEWLQAENCFLMQGYLFSPPLRAHECIARLSLQDALQMDESRGGAGTSVS